MALPEATTADLIRLFNLLAIGHLEGSENLITPIQIFCNTTANPSETLLVLTAHAISAYADLVGEHAGKDAAIQHFREQTLALEIEEAASEGGWDRHE